MNPSKSYKNYPQHSIFCQFIQVITTFFTHQWKNSGVINAFLTPNSWDHEVEKQSVFYKLWNTFRKSLTSLFVSLKLEGLFAGSIFTQTLFWALLTLTLAPFLPTMVLLAFALVSGCSLLLQLLRNPDVELAYAPMNRYIVLYAALYLLASFVSVTPSASIKVALLSCALLLFSITIQNAVKSQGQLQALVGLIVIAGAGVALYGIYQYLFRAGYQSAAWVDSEMFESITFRVPSTLDNPNMLGQYFILTIPFAGACLLSSKEWGARVFWTAMAGVQLLCMILTFSRGAWLGLLFAGMLFFLLIDGRFAYAIPVAMLVLLVTLPASVIERFTSIGDVSDASTSYRVYIWMGTLAMLSASYWLCGIGAGDLAFNKVYPAYSYSGIVAPHSHNLFLQIVCDGGIFLLVVFLLILFQYARGLCIEIKRSTQWKGKLYQIASLSGIGGFLVQAMTDYSFYNYRVMFLFWAVVGVGGIAMNYQRLPKSV